MFKTFVSLLYGHASWFPVDKVCQNPLKKQHFGEQVVVTEFRKFTRIFFLDRAFSIMKTKINQRNAQINSG